MNLTVKTGGSHSAPELRQMSVKTSLFFLILLGMAVATRTSTNVKIVNRKLPQSSTNLIPERFKTMFEESDEEEEDDDNDVVKKVKEQPEVVDEDDETEDETEDKESEASFDEEEPEFVFAETKNDKIKAWNLATRLTDRNPKIWRVDRQNNVILSCDYTISSPLSFKALVKEEQSGFVSLEAVQGEYYGVDDESNHKNALKYRPKDQEQDDLLSLIEIALLGNVSDDRGESYCWCPSSIHQDLFLRDDAARRWHRKLFDYDFKYGMAGHNLAFQHMNVALKDVRHLPESTLDRMDQKNTLLYIHNYQSQCSDAINHINFNGNAAKRAENIKNNWGLTRVTEFVDHPIRTTFAPAPVTRKAVVPKAKTLASSIANAPKKPTTTVTNANGNTGSLSMSEIEWPSLSALSSNEKAPAKKAKVVKKKPVVIDI